MKTVAVIFGGKSTEHDVSIITALSSVIRPLLMTKKYAVLPVYITKDGEWFADESLGDVALFSTGGITDKLAKMQPVHLTVGKGLSFVWPAKGLKKAAERAVDVVFPAMHGAHGEDGDLMGLLEMAGVPYVGCGVAASAIAMDKVLAKQVASADDVPSTPWLWCSGAQAIDDTDQIVHAAMQKLGFPIFVKPAHLGSSIGITRATTELELRNALEVAAHYDNKIIIEQGVANLTEVTLPIMGNSNLRPALLERPLTQAEDFFDFETKYLHGGKKGSKGGKTSGAQGYSQLPADLPEDLYDKAVKVGLATYRAIGCEGIARVDMLIDSESGIVYFNEVNPLPGSLYAHNWRQAGLSSVELVEELIVLAEERSQSVNSKATTFSTSFLKQF